MPSSAHLTPPTRKSLFSCVIFTKIKNGRPPRCLKNGRWPHDILSMEDGWRTTTNLYCNEDNLHFLTKRRQPQSFC